MPRFIIERRFAEAIEVTPERNEEIRRVNDDVGVQWIFSFLSVDKKKTYCLYEAPSAEKILEAAKRLNLPADEIIEVGGELRPDMFS
jgi:hypothetical protein